MANANDVSFEIDAGVVLAKLHLAGAQAVSNKVQVLNSGIQNQSNYLQPPKPENPGKVLFDCDNKGGSYQMAMTSSIASGFVSYKCKVDIKKLKEFNEALARYNESKGKDNALSSELSASSESTSKTGSSASSNNASDSTDKVTDDVDKNAINTAKKENSESSSQSKTEGSKDNSKNTSEDSKGKLGEEAKVLLKVMKDYGFKAYKEDPNDVDASMAAFKKSIEEENITRKEEYQKNLDVQKKDAYQTAKAYFEQFAGKDNSSKIKPQDIVVIGRTVGDLGKAPKIEDISKLCTVKKYKIEVNNNSREIAALEEKTHAENINEYISFYPIFSTGFGVETETI